MNISLRDELKQLVEDQLTTRGFGTSSGYVRDLLEFVHALRTGSDRMAQHRALGNTLRPTEVDRRTKRARLHLQRIALAQKRLARPNRGGHAPRGFHRADDVTGIVHTRDHP